MNCPRCGKETEQSGTFCQFCGANLKEFLTKPFPRKRVGGIKTEKFAGLGGRFLGGLIDLFFVLLFDIMAAALVGVISWLFGRPDPVSETVRMLYQYYYHVPRTDASGQVVNAVVPPRSSSVQLSSSSSSHGFTLPISRAPATSQRLGNWQ